MNKQRVFDTWMQQGYRCDDPEVWGMLCGWLALHPRRAARRYEFPQVVQPLLGRAREAQAVRDDLAERDLLPIMYRVGWGWRLRRNWEWRLRCWRVAQRRVIQSDNEFPF